MALEDITLAAFAAANSLRVFAYVPQIHKAPLIRTGHLQFLAQHGHCFC